MGLSMKVAATVLVVVAVAATIAYMSLQPGGGEKRLVVYTYESLLKWGKNPEATWDKVFGEFERRYGVEVQVVEFPDAREALLTVLEEARRGGVRADVIIGLDNLLIVEAKDAGILEKYTPSSIGDIPEWLIEALDPEGYAMPYDYGLIAFVYIKDKVNGSLMEGLRFEDFYDPQLAGMLVLEDPTKSSTGLSFLLWQITVYEKILSKDWKEWWLQVKEHVNVQPSWGDAYDVFLDEASGRPVVVSYGTDPAYSFYFYNDTSMGAAVVTYNGKRYAWLQVEGIAILKNAPHKELAEKFVDWFLSPEVQAEIPLNNWMYPANSRVQLPEPYRYALDPGDFEIVNTYISSEELSQHYREWLNTWMSIMAGG